MTATISSIWRYPIKSHGREEIPLARLVPGQCLPGDRIWAVAHIASSADGSRWVPCANFTICSKAPKLAAIRAKWHETTGLVSLRHPQLGKITFNPDEDPANFLAWSAPLLPPGRAASARIVKVSGRGLTDSEFPSISLNNLASHRDVAERMELPELSTHRWRGNIWIDGLQPWEEAGWIGREVLLGEAALRIREPITRCLATAANPDTGARDADTLGALNSFGHREFGVYAEVMRGGLIRPGDRVQCP